MFLRGVVLALAVSSLVAADARIVLLAGTPSHPPGAHEYNAGMLLFAQCLRQNPGVQPVVVKGGWPEDESVFAGAAAVVFFMDGGVQHAALPHLELLAKLARQGVGMGAIHYGVDVPVDPGGPKFLEWFGGYYEKDYSRNPINDVMLTQASPKHPVSNGWASYQLRDEWYFRIRFRPFDPRFTPILTAALPKDAPSAEPLAWVIERPDGGRGFGFTGGHFHSNWGQLEQRRLVLNGLLWIARAPVPAGGAKCNIAHGDLTKNLDDKPAPSQR